MEKGERGNVPLIRLRGLNRQQLVETKPLFVILYRVADIVWAMDITRGRQLDSTTDDAPI